MLTEKIDKVPKLPNFLEKYTYAVMVIAISTKSIIMAYLRIFCIRSSETGWFGWTTGAILHTIKKLTPKRIATNIG